MIVFLIRKIWSNKLMILCLLVGNILLVGIVAATPLYTLATMQRILQQDLHRYQLTNNTFPAVMELSYRFNGVLPEHQVNVYHTTRSQSVPEMIQEMDVPLLLAAQVNTGANWHAVPYPEREVNPRIRSFSLVGAEGMPGQVRILQGRLPSSELLEEQGRHIIEIIASEAALVWHDMLYGELLATSNIDFPQGPLYLRVVGIYTLAEGSDLYWSVVQADHQNIVLVSDELVLAHLIENYINDFNITVNWAIVLDYTYMRARNVDSYLSAATYLSERFNTGQNIWQFTANFTETIQGHRVRTARLAITLWVLQAPLYVLLAFYIYTVSRQILMMEQNAISVLKSRGVSRAQLMIVYALQGLAVAIVSFPLGIWLGVFVCRMLGASGGFLQFVLREALHVELAPVVFAYAAVALFFSFLTMWLPVLAFSRTDIVGHKRRNSGAKRKALWQRFFLDFLCLGVSLYSLFTFTNQQESMAMVRLEDRAVDPLLFISSSLFIIGFGLLCLRVFPLLVRLVFALGRRFWPSSMFASLLKVVRSAGEEQFIMIFLVFTMAVGVFSAQAAGTINLNNDHNIKHLAGADLMFREAWQTIVIHQAPIGGGGMGPGGSMGQMPEIQIIVQAPDFQRLTGFDEVEAITQVQRHLVTVRQGTSTVNNVTLMGIETDTFGQTAWYRNDLLDIHINYFLNVLASNAEGVLLSDNFRTQLGYRLGDTLMYRTTTGDYIRGVVVGFVAHWPGFANIGHDQRENYLLVANLGHLHTQWGVRPYQVWMRTNTDSNYFFHEFRIENDLELIEFYDAKASVIESRSDPILQGTNGVLTAVFIVTLLVCFTGFLIYWVLSIRARVLQFGIFRAMGMGVGGLITLLINEQVFITFTAIGIGAVVGEITARLFVPLIQLSFTVADQAIPLLVVNQARYYRNLYAVIGVMVCLCLIILAVYVSRIRIAQALKLGEE